MVDVAVDIVALRSALARAIDRTSGLLAGADGAKRLHETEWSVSDIALHLALMAEAYIGYAEGRTEPFVDVSDVAGGSLARTSAARLAAEPNQDIATLDARLVAGGRTLLDVTADRNPTDRVLWNGQPITLASMLGIALGEHVLHGLDIARTLDQNWEVSADDARLVLASVLPLLPLLVDPATTKDITASYDLRVRGGPRVGLRIDHGVLDTIAPDGSVDCHISADPVALLLVSYGRRSQWIPALTGRLVAWGRKPWLGLRLTKYLVAP